MRNAFPFFPVGWEYSFSWFIGSWVIGVDLFLVMFLLMIVLPEWLASRRRHRGDLSP